MSANRVKPKTPYQRLLEAAQKFASEIQYPHTKFMWRYPKKRLHEGWSLTDLAERVSAADQLGFDVLLVNDDEGLKVIYRKRAPATPWEFK